MNQQEKSTKISLLHDMVQEHRQKSALAIEQKEVLKQQSEYLNSTLMKVRETMWPETGACVNTGSYMCPPKNYNAPAAKICSPGYPNAYGDLNTCIYNIAVKEGSRVELRFLTFSTYSSNTYVKVYDGNSTSSPNLTERMSGNPTISSLKSIKSSGRYLTIKFAANYNYGSIGWQAEYKTIA
uniref:CUB domain-containing protein n=1 Tax=Ditylenchus dipsaci TaxID=166011 RepID=A0A915DEL6_9BILA